MILIKFKTFFYYFFLIFSIITIISYHYILIIDLSEFNNSQQVILKTNSDAPIYINDNNELELISTKGNGTLYNPYIIKDLNINGEGSESCINISNTNKYFIIQNCSLKNRDSNPTIRFTNVSFGRIYNNQISQGEIFILHSRNITISENYLFNESGSRLSNTNFSIFENNTFLNCSGIIFSDCNYNIIRNNYMRYCYEGNIVLFGSVNNIIRNNELYDGEMFGIGLFSDSKNNTIKNNYIFNNSIQEIRIQSDLIGFNTIDENFFEYKEEEPNGGDGIPVDLTPLIILIVIIAIAVVIIIATPIMIRRYRRKKKEKYMLPED